MAYVEYEIIGLSPLLMNSPESMGKTDAMVGVKNIPTPEAEAERKVYKLPNGQLFIPSIAFRSSVLKACTGRRIGKISAKSVLSGSLFLTSEEVPLYHPETKEPISKYEIDVRRTVVQGHGVHRARPMIRDWAGMITFEYDEELLQDAKIITTLMDLAGKTKGVGDYRPEKTGPYGRFRVERL